MTTTKSSLTADVALSDALAAKQTISARLLRAHLSERGRNLMPALRVEAAVRAAGSNVHGVGVGRKVVDGVRTEQVCVRLYVTQKLAPSLLPERDRLPESIDGIPTDVIQAAPPRLLARRARAAARLAGVATVAACSTNRRNRQRPVVPGISAAHRLVTAGTISCFCRSTRHGDDPADIFVLSNNHVFANVNSASLGDDLCQPGPADGGVAADHFADLHRFVGIHLGGSVPNRVDGAIGRLRPDVPYSTGICSVGQISGTLAVSENLPVRKHGRTTGLTTGFVDDVSIDELIGMDHEDPNVVALFQDQIRIVTDGVHGPFGLGGDSGSLVVHGQGQEAVGLYFAGPEAGDWGLANPIADVLNELEIEIL